MNVRKTLSLLVATLALGACSSTHYVSIRHPLHVGQVDQNEVPFEARRVERDRGLGPGSLVDRAQLTEVTPERICEEGAVESVSAHSAVVICDWSLAGALRRALASTRARARCCGRHTRSRPIAAPRPGSGRC